MPVLAAKVASAFKLLAAFFFIIALLTSSFSSSAAGEPDERGARWVAVQCAELVSVFCQPLKDCLPSIAFLATKVKIGMPYDAS